jgi:DNA (cytosine-5)-methyltransferase 1
MCEEPKFIQLKDYTNLIIARYKIFLDSFLNMSDKPKAIDLFCGAGGISEGLKQAGFDVIWATDHDEDCVITHEANHEAKTVQADIREIDPEKDVDLEPEDVDVVAGGPPCPTFSVVGRSKINSIEGRTNGEDERHQLYEHFLRFVNYFEPDVLLMENVEGMQSAKNKEGEDVVEIIEDEMRDLGYQVESQCLDAANFGVPQHRKRLFFIGSKVSGQVPDMEEWRSHREPDNEEEKMIKPKNNPHRLEQGKLSDSMDDQPDFPHYEKDRENKIPWNTVGDAIMDLPPVYPERTDGDSLSDDYSRQKDYRVPALTQYQEWVRDIPEGVSLQDHIIAEDSLEELHYRVSELEKKLEGDPEVQENEIEKIKSEIKDQESRGHNIRDLTLYKILGEGTGYKIGDLPDEFQPYRKDIFNDNYKKQNPKEPASTIVAHISKDGHMFIHPNEARSLTPREAARLQSFPDSYIFPQSRTSTYKQIGNAVPPLLGRAIGIAIRKEILEI